MAYRHFLKYNVIGAFLWGVGVTCSATSSASSTFVKDNIELILIGIVGVSLVPVAFEVWRARRAGAATSATTRTTSAPPSPTVAATTEHDDGRTAVGALGRSPVPHRAPRGDHDEHAERPVQPAAAARVRPQPHGSASTAPQPHGGQPAVRRRPLVRLGPAPPAPGYGSAPVGPGLASTVQTP